MSTSGWVQLLLGFLAAAAAYLALVAYNGGRIDIGGKGSMMRLEKPAAAAAPTRGS